MADTAVEHYLAALPQETGAEKAAWLVAHHLYEYAKHLERRVAGLEYALNAHIGLHVERDAEEGKD